MDIGLSPLPLELVVFMIQWLRGAGDDSSKSWLWLIRASLVQYRGHQFDPCSRKIPRAVKQLNL